MKAGISAGLLVLAGIPSFAHRLDEYLQGTLLSVEKDRIHAQITLTPGVVVFPFLISEIDADANGMISDAEQRSYANGVLGDLSLAIDGNRLTPRLISMQFPSIDEMKEGRGGIHLEFEADLPRGGSNRRLTLENRHQSRVAAYQVNCLAPSDPRIRVLAQNRNYSQSRYELEYEDADAGSEPPSSALWSASSISLSAIVLLLSGRLTFVLRQRRRRVSLANM